MGKSTSKSITPQQKAKRRESHGASARSANNIVLIHARELGRFVEPYPGGVAAPNLRRLAARGMTFTRAFAGALGTDPAGACIFTGQPAHQVGMFGPAQWYRLQKPAHHVASILCSNGYTAATFGYQHFQESSSNLGFGSEDPRSTGAAGEVARGAIEFMENRRDTKPFFLSIGFRETARDSTKLSIVESRSSADANFLQMVDRIDEAVGQVLDAVENQDLEKSTLVLFTSAHGGRDPLLRLRPEGDEFKVAMILAGPGGFHGGELHRALVSHLDLVPTILEVAGVDSPDDVKGRSLVPLARLEAGEGRDHLVTTVNVLHSGAWPNRVV